MANKFWRSLQTWFGLNRRDHRFDVPEDVRFASHSQANETIKLKAQIVEYERDHDALRELVDAMQDRLNKRGRQ